jgi:hypothetical protein
MFKRTIIAMTLALLWTAGSKPAIAGPDDSYAVVKLDNKTPFRIRYTYRWDNDGDEERGQIAPHKSYLHWWTFDYAGEDFAPWFYVQLDGGSGWYKLGTFYSPDHTGKTARHYVIRHKQTEDGVVFRIGEKLETR